MAPSRFGGTGPTDAIRRLAQNDPAFTVCNLSNNAVLQDKRKQCELMPLLGKALTRNDRCRELILSGCALDDDACECLAMGLKVCSNSRLQMFTCSARHRC